MSSGYLIRSNFSSDDAYAKYIRCNIKIGMQVKVHAFDIDEPISGTVVKLDHDGLHDKNVGVNIFGTLWLKYCDVSLLEDINIGDVVRVKADVIEPIFKWGSVKKHSIGVATAISSDGSIILVNFPEDSTWKGHRDDMEKIPHLHPDVSCNNCKSLSIKGCRYKCSTCRNFDLCEECFKSDTEHKHIFLRIVCPGSRPGHAGPPGCPVTIGSMVRVKKNVRNPKHGWGKIKDRRSIGIVKAVCVDGEEVIVDFEKQPGWTGDISEMDPVDSVHTGVQCDGCKLLPIGGARYKCSQCDDFDYCEECFITKTNHNHDFRKIKEPGKTAIPVGQPPLATMYKAESDDESSDDSSLGSAVENFTGNFLKLMILNKALEAMVESVKAPTPDMPELKPESVPPAAIKKKVEDKCDYQKLCRRYKDSLGLHANLFEDSFDQCFCFDCHKKRGDRPVYQRGEPPKSYALPVGWCRFGLSTPARTKSLRAFETWHVAFHGTKPECIQKILDTGDLLMPGDKTLEGTAIRPPSNHFDPETTNPKLKPPQGHDIKKIFLSPSMLYSGCEVYAPVSSFRDPLTSKQYGVRVALQVRIKPGSYQVGDQTIGATSQMDPFFPNSELEWFTDARGAVILTGLLFKIEDMVTLKHNRKLQRQKCLIS